MPAMERTTVWALAWSSPPGCRKELWNSGAATAAAGVVGGVGVADGTRAWTWDISWPRGEDAPSSLLGEEPGEISPVV